MSLIEQLKEQSRFTDAEKILANFILDNINQISHMTIYELSECSFCSVATISRFCKKLRLKNYNDLKLSIVHECANSKNFQRIEYNYPFAKESSYEEVENNLYKLFIQTIEEMHESLDLENIKKIAKILDKASVVDIYANWNSMNCALNLHSKLLWMGKNSNLEVLQGYQSIKARIPAKDHIAVIVSYFGTSERNIQIARDLVQNNVPYILITGPQLNPLCLQALEVIHTVPEEENSRKIAAFSSDLAMEYAVNVLYSFMFALHYDENLKIRVENQNSI